LFFCQNEETISLKLT